MASRSALLFWETSQSWQFKGGRGLSRERARPPDCHTTQDPPPHQPFPTGDRDMKRVLCDTTVKVCSSARPYLSSSFIRKWPLTWSLENPSLSPFILQVKDRDSPVGEVIGLKGPRYIVVRTRAKVPQAPVRPSQVFRRKAAPSLGWPHRQAYTWLPKATDREGECP